MIPVMMQSGARGTAPDFLGFGHSDKPVQDAPVAGVDSRLSPRLAAVFQNQGAQPAMRWISVKTWMPHL